MRSRIIKVTIRLTEKEAAYLRKESANFENNLCRTGRDNFSEYLRQMLMAQSGYSNPKLERILSDLRYELRKIGTNVNQIAHKINGGFGNPGDVEELKRYLKDIEEELERVSREADRNWRSQN